MENKITSSWKCFHPLLSNFHCEVPAAGKTQRHFLAQCLWNPNCYWSVKTLSKLRGIWFWDIASNHISMYAPFAYCFNLFTVQFNCCTWVFVILPQIHVKYHFLPWAVRTDYKAFLSLNLVQCSNSFKSHSSNKASQSETSAFKSTDWWSLFGNEWWNDCLKHMVMCNEIAMRDNNNDSNNLWQAVDCWQWPRFNF